MPKTADQAKEVKEGKHSWPALKYIARDVTDGSSLTPFVKKGRRHAFLTTVQDAKNLRFVCGRCDTVCVSATIKGHCEKCINKNDEDINKGEFYLIQDYFYDQ